MNRLRLWLTCNTVGSRQHHMRQSLPSSLTSVILCKCTGLVKSRCFYNPTFTTMSTSKKDLEHCAHARIRCQSCESLTSKRYEDTCVQTHTHRSPQIVESRNSPPTACGVGRAAVQANPYDISNIASCAQGGRELCSSAPSETKQLRDYVEARLLR